MTIRGGNLRSVGEIAKILGKEGLRDLGFNIHIEGKVTTRQAIKLNKTEKELPSTSDVAKADDIELQEFTENVARSTNNLIKQFEELPQGQKTLCMHELQGLDKQLRSIRGLLKVEVAKKVQLEKHIKQEKRKLMAIQDNPEYNDGIREDIRNKIAKLNDDLSVRQEIIELIKGRLKDQITSFKETIAKVLDKDVSLGEKIRKLFRE